MNEGKIHRGWKQTTHSDRGTNVEELDRKKKSKTLFDFG